MSEELLTMLQVAERTGMTYSYVRTICQDKDHPAHLPNRAYPTVAGKMRRRITMTDFLKWSEERTS